MRSEYVARGKPNSFQVTSNTQSLRLWSGEVRRRASSKRSRLKRKEENFITKNRAERQHERARTPLVSCKPRASCNTRNAWAVKQELARSLSNLDEIARLKIERDDAACKREVDAGSAAENPGPGRRACLPSAFGGPVYLL